MRTGAGLLLSSLDSLDNTTQGGTHGRYQVPGAEVIKKTLEIVGDFLIYHDLSWFIMIYTVDF